MDPIEAANGYLHSLEQYSPWVGDQPSLTPLLAFPYGTAAFLAPLITTGAIRAVSALRLDFAVYCHPGIIDPELRQELVTRTDKAQTIIGRPPVVNLMPELDL